MSVRDLHQLRVLALRGAQGVLETGVRERLRNAPQRASQIVSRRVAHLCVQGAFRAL